MQATNRTAERPPGRRRGIQQAVALIGAMTLALAAFPALAAAASASPTIASSFIPNLIGVGNTTPTALAYTLTNPNASASSSAVGFTDTLPAGLTIDDPNGLNGNCGTTGTITAAPGSQTVSLSGGSIKAGSTCTFSVSVVSSQAGAFQDTPGAPTSSAGAGTAGAAAALTVLPPPTVLVGAPAAKAKFAYGQVARARFSCAQSSDPAALAGCLASDDQGNSVNPGGLLDTKVPGTHTLTVDATSSDGLTTEQDVTYTVLPDNRFTVPHPRVTRGGVLELTLKLPGAGRLLAVATAGQLTFAQTITRVSAARRLVVSLSPTHAGEARLKPMKPGATTPAVHLRLQVTYTPTGGVKRTITVGGITVR